MIKYDIPVSPELLQCVQELRAILGRRVQLINATLTVLIEHPSGKALRPETTPIPPESSRALLLMLQALLSSSNTVIHLSEAPSLATRDCYSIARSIVELAVNVCYLIAAGPAVTDKAFRHATQKAYRDLQRESTIGESTISIALSGCPDAANIPGMEEHLAEFTYRSGREKDWVDASLDERIATAGDRLGKNVLTPLHLARFIVYRHSSEILHGSLFSALYFFGLTQPTKQNRQDFAAENIGQQHMLLLMACCLAHDAVINAFHNAYGFQWANDRSKELNDAMGDLAYFCKLKSTQ